jgi:hypothetical protein
MLSHVAQQLNVPIENVLVGFGSLAVLTITIVAAAIYFLTRPKRRKHRRMR